MALGLYYPRPGDVLNCNFNGFIEPEIVKPRPVVVVSGRERHAGRLCTVVPLSTTAPHPIKSWHCEIAAVIPGWSSDTHWIKGDMIYTVSFDRLTKPYDRMHGTRNHQVVRLDQDVLTSIRQCVLAYLHF